MDMTGRERIEAAFSRQGASDVAAVVCYEGIYIRDHWEALTGVPWWHRLSYDLHRQLTWRREVIRKTRQDWLAVQPFHSRSERDRFRIEPRPDGVFRVDTATGQAKRLDRPRVGGWSATGGVRSTHPARLASTPDEIDKAIGVRPAAGDAAGRSTDDGSGDLAERLLAEFGRELWPVGYVASPFWRCYGLWGFEGLMRFTAEAPKLVSHACDRFLAMAVEDARDAGRLGAAGVWIEECMTDMIAPRAFETLVAACNIRLVEAIRGLGLKSIYYFCGDPRGKWDHILSIGADAISLEESKKGFSIDVEDVVDRANSRCVVLGNLDSVGVLQDGTDQQLAEEISRQIAAGRRNASRFIMSLGSPVTPATSVDRVRRYCDVARDLGRA